MSCARARPRDGPLGPSSASIAPASRASSSAGSTNTTGRLARRASEMRSSATPTSSGTTPRTSRSAAPTMRPFMRTAESSCAPLLALNATAPRLRPRRSGTRRPVAARPVSAQGRLKSARSWLQMTQSRPKLSGSLRPVRSRLRLVGPAKSGENFAKRRPPGPLPRPPPLLAALTAVPLPLSSSLGSRQHLPLVSPCSCWPAFLGVCLRARGRR